MKRMIFYYWNLLLSVFYSRKIVCFGTSLTESGNWVNMLKKKLSGLLVINSGRGGMNSNWGFDNIEKLVLRFRPQIVLMEFAINDCFIGKEYYKTPSLAESMFNMRTMFNLLKENNIKVYLLSMNPPLNKHIQGRNPFEDRPEYKRFFNAHRNLAESLGIPVIDITKVWEGLSEDKFLEYCPDGLHPIDSGSENITVPNILQSVFMMESMLT